MKVNFLQYSRITSEENEWCECECGLPFSLLLVNNYGAGFSHHYRALKKSSKVCENQIQTAMIIRPMLKNSKIMP